MDIQALFGDMPIAKFADEYLQATNETAISLAVGVMSRLALAVYEFLRSRLVQSLVWRQRLPLTNPSERSRVELDAMYRHMFAQLAEDLAKTFADPGLVCEFLEESEARYGMPQ